MSKKTSFDSDKAKRLIKEKGIKILWLADRCDVSAEYMSQVVNGRRKPSVGLTRLMAYALDVTEDVLTRGATKAKAS